MADETAKYMMGEAAGFCLLYDGGCMPCGRLCSDCAIAVCTSCAAASMLRSRVNCRVMLTEPWVLVDVMLSMPGIVENCFSSGVATAAAMVSGLAPGRPARTEIVGKSTVGRSATGSAR